jgi:HSP20 family protein
MTSQLPLGKAVFEMAIIRRNDGGRGLVRARGWDPFEMMQELIGAEPFRELTRGEATGFVPTFEVKETKDSYTFKADLPGVKESDVEISLSGNMLTISGKREEEKKDEGDRYFAYERSYGTFSRSFTLPEGADTEHVRAELKDGVLTIAVPKKPEVQPRRIDVQSSGKSDDKDQAKA